MMGALLEATDCLPFTTAQAVLNGLVKNPKLAEMNDKALAAGRNYLTTSTVTPVLAGAVAGSLGFPQVNDVRRARRLTKRGA